MNKKKLLIASLPLLLLPLTGCDLKQATGNISGEVEGAVENVLPNLWVALAQLGAFIVMVVVFIIFCYKPIKKRLQARKDNVKKNIDEANSKNIQAERNVEVSKMQIKDSRRQADKIITDASKAAQIQADEIIQKANQQAENIRIQSEKDALERLKEVEREAHDEIVTSAIAASKQILSREIDEEDNEKVIDDFLKQMKEDK